MTCRTDRTECRGIKRLGELLGSQFRAGIVLYDREHVLPFGEQLSAAPLSALSARKPKSNSKAQGNRAACTGELEFSVLESHEPATGV